MHALRGLFSYGGSSGRTIVGQEIHFLLEIDHLSMKLDRFVAMSYLLRLQFFLFFSVI